jgi:hypothetical protein
MYVTHFCHKANEQYTLIRFFLLNDKFGTCTVVRVNGTLVEDKLLRFEGLGSDFSLKKCPFETHDCASAKFSTNSQETDNSVHTHCNPFRRS